MEVAKIEKVRYVCNEFYFLLLRLFKDSKGFQRQRRLISEPYLEGDGGEVLQWAR